MVEHLTFNQVVGGSNPPCLIKKRDRIFPISFFYEIGARSPDNVLSGGAQGPVDLGMRRPERSVESNPPCLISFTMLLLKNVLHFKLSGESLGNGM